MIYLTWFNIMLRYSLIGAIIDFWHDFTYNRIIDRANRGEQLNQKQMVKLLAAVGFKIWYKYQPFHIKIIYHVGLTVFWLPLVIIAVVKAFKQIKERLNKEG